MAMVKVAYRFALDPSPAQGRALRSHAGALPQAARIHAAAPVCSACRHPAGRITVKRELGTRTRGKTGTAAARNDSGMSAAGHATVTETCACR